MNKLIILLLFPIFLNGKMLFVKDISYPNPKLPTRHYYIKSNTESFNVSIYKISKTQYITIPRVSFEK